MATLYLDLARSLKSRSPMAALRTHKLSAAELLRTMARDKILSREHIYDLIADGKHIVIYDQRVLRLDSWMEKHPGGKLTIRHMVGRDATDEINAYHSSKVLKTMGAFQIGRIEGVWVNFTPPIRGGIFLKEGEEKKIELVAGCGSLDFGSKAIQQEVDRDLKLYPSVDIKTQHDIVLKYQDLHRRVKEAGHYNCRYIEYAKEASRFCTLFLIFLVFLRYEWYLTSAVFLGLFWHQIMFTAHDAGHMGITSRFHIDTLIGIFVADFCCGLSIGWWKSSHNVHHLITNQPEHDPDIQNVPLFATSPIFFKSIKSSYYDDFQFKWDAFANVAVQVQHYLYYPIMCVARFSLYLLSWIFLLSNKAPKLGAAAWTRPTEILFMFGYWYLFGYALLWKSIPTWTLRVAFVLVSHFVTMPLHVQITLSHWAMSTTDLGETESFAQKQLRTTMDVECPAWFDFIHGGLQFQAVHHLFPRVPRHNLRAVQVMVKEFCKDVGIEYKILRFVDGNKEVIGRLGEIGKQVEMLVQCQKYMAETGENMDMWAEYAPRLDLFITRK